MRARRVLLALLLTGCAGTQRECASCQTEVSGGDWIVVQLAADGAIRNCWQLRGVAIAQEAHSDGIWWYAGAQQVHISGWYNYVQATGGMQAAAGILGVDLARCPGGAYVAPAVHP